MTLFNVEVLPQGIIKFTVLYLTRESIDAWVDYVVEHAPRMKAPLRLMYDFRNVGYPTPYLIQRAVEISNTVPVPEDTRSGYLAKPFSAEVFIRTYINRLAARSGVRRVFTDEDTLIAWLLELD